MVIRTYGVTCLNKSTKAKFRSVEFYFRYIYIYIIRGKIQLVGVSSWGAQCQLLSTVKLIWDEKYIKTHVQSEYIFIKNKKEKNQFFVGIINLFQL